VPSRYFGLIPAAGAGSRFGGNLPKQYSKIQGRPVLHHAIAALLAAAEIRSVFVVLAPGDDEFKYHDWSRFEGKLQPLYCGGATRRDTVMHAMIAMAAAMDPDDWILVHDAARPCLAASDLRRLIDDVSREQAGGLLAVPVSDTLKRAVDEGDSVKRAWTTESREGLWQAQTPQMFRYGMLLRALRDAPHVTDEASAIEAIGHKPRLVEGSPRNLKITYATDLELARLILASTRNEPDLSS
jgi:2-C-methyl-D-erythritol 4-phosphate cytidylyltransferase